MLWLAIDAGTTGLKAGLVWQKEGGILALEAHEVRPYPTRTEAGGVAEQDAEDWWRAAVEAWLTLYRNTGLRPDAIALTGQMQDVVLLDDAGEAVRPVILYSDARATAEADALAGRLDMAALAGLVGSEQGPGSLLAKLAWLDAHEPDAQACTTHLLMGAADLLAFRLTGHAAADTTTASTTGLMNLAQSRFHAGALFEQAGLAGWQPKLPKLVSGGARVGRLSRSAAELLDLTAGLPVHLGPGDAGATTIGAGCGAPGSASLYVGSSGWAALTLPADQRPPVASGVFTLAHPAPDSVFVIAPLLTAGGNLSWARDVLGSPADSFDEIIEAAAAREPTRLLYLPYLAGERSPFTDPYAAGAFIGLRAHHTRDDLARAVLEGVALAYRHVLASLLPELPQAGLLLTGGGARSAAWGQIFADVLGVPVRRAAALEHIGLLGAVAAAQFQAGDADAFTRLTTLHAQSPAEHPGEAMRAHYDVQFSLYAQAYPVLKSIFHAQQA
jgi:xylulokinase